MDYDALIVGSTFSWITWVVFSSLRRYLVGRSQAALQEKIFSRLDSVESLVALTSTEAGRRLLDSLSIERAEPPSPAGRILGGVQAGLVLSCFGLAMLFLHRVRMGDGFLVLGVGAVGLGLGFVLASGASVWTSRALGLLRRDAGR